MPISIMSVRYWHSSTSALASCGCHPWSIAVWILGRCARELCVPVVGQLPALMHNLRKMRDRWQHGPVPAQSLELMQAELAALIHTSRRGSMGGNSVRVRPFGRSAPAVIDMRTLSGTSIRIILRRSSRKVRELAANKTFSPPCHPSLQLLSADPTHAHATQPASDSLHHAISTFAHARPTLLSPGIYLISCSCTFLAVHHKGILSCPP